jgi:hypothetical protein
MSDYVRTLGVNGGVFAAVSLADIEMVLKIILLSVTILWTVVKCYKLLTDDNEGKTEK